jgi:hypothetical protein
MSYEEKYLKYKIKYLELKGGNNSKCKKITKLTRSVSAPIKLRADSLKLKPEIKPALPSAPAAAPVPRAPVSSVAPVAARDSIIIRWSTDNYIVSFDNEDIKLSELKILFDAQYTKQNVTWKAKKFGIFDGKCASTGDQKCKPVEDSLTVKAFRQKYKDCYLIILPNLN